MARVARIKADGESAAYHLYGRVAGERGWYPLCKPLCRKTLIDLMKRYSKAYCCSITAYSIMGSHYHAVAQFEAFRTLSRAELRERALSLYPNSESMLDDWTQDRWDRLQERLFDVSEFMRNVHSAFARFYNKSYQRHGKFWADRFKSTLLENTKAMLDCMLYVELNPVRAGLVERPEEWEGSSLLLREAGLDGWLMPLSDIFEKTKKQALMEYRCLVYYRGGVPNKTGQAAISQRIIQEEASRGFEVSGVYRKRLRYFVDGLVVGSEGYIREKLGSLQEAGQYLRRKNPVAHLDGVHLSLRPQRDTVVAF